MDGDDRAASISMLQEAMASSLPDYFEPELTKRLDQPKTGY